MQALIIGGGVAGTVAAMALQDAGIGATIFESHSAADGEVGSYLTVTANGLEGLRSIGALHPVIAAGAPTRRNILWNEKGRRLATISLDSSLPGSPTAVTLKRARLASILQGEALRRGVAIEYGRRLVTAHTATDGRVIAEFEDGSQSEGDLLIGADGVHSVVRRTIDPAAPTGRYVGLTNFGGLTRGAGSGIEPEAWHLIFGRRAFFGYQAVANGDVIWFANVPRPLITPDERASTSAAAWQRWLADLYGDDAGPAVELIEAGVFELAADNTHDLGHVPTWHRGPMVIIGDAAHAPAPTSGQGASMAIEDGIVLARALRGRSIADGFATYEQARRERVERIVAWGARGSSAKVPGAVGRLTRDVMLRLLFRFVVTERSTHWMYDYRFDDIEVPMTAAARAA